MRCQREEENKNIHDQPHLLTYLFIYENVAPFTKYPRKYKIIRKAFSFSMSITGKGRPLRFQILLTISIHPPKPFYWTHFVCIFPGHWKLSMLKATSLNLNETLKYWWLLECKIDIKHQQQQHLRPLRALRCKKQKIKLIWLWMIQFWVYHAEKCPQISTI